MTKHILVYCRLSLTKDDGHNISIERQVSEARERIKTLAFLFDEAIDLFVEPPGHRSGYEARNRPAFKQLLEAIETRKNIGALLVYNLSRFSRGDDAMSLLLSIARKGIQFISLHEEVDLETPHGRTVTRIQTLSNVIYREAVSESQRNAYQSAKRDGAYITRKTPLGVKAQGHGKHRIKIASREGVYLFKGELVVGTEDDPPFYRDTHPFHSYLETVRQYFNLLVQFNAGARLASQWLNAHHYYAQRNDRLPRPVQEADCRQFRIHLATYRGLLRDDLLDEAAQRIKSNAQGLRGRTHTRHIPPVLWRLLYCHYCNHRLITGADSNHGMRYKHSHHHCISPHAYRSNTLDKQLWTFLDAHLKLSSDDLQQIARELVTRQAPTPIDHEPRRQEIRKQLSRLREMLSQDRITEMEYDEDRKGLLDELEGLVDTPKLIEHQWTEDEWLEFLQDITSILRDASHQDTRIVNALLRRLFDRIIVRDGTLVFCPRTEYAYLFNRDASGI